VGCKSGSGSDDGSLYWPPVSPPPHLQSTILFSQPSKPLFLGGLCLSSEQRGRSNCEPVTLPELSLHPASGDGPFLAEATGHCWGRGSLLDQQGSLFLAHTCRRLTLAAIDGLEGHSGVTRDNCSPLVMQCCVIRVEIKRHVPENGFGGLPCLSNQRLIPSAAPSNRMHCNHWILPSSSSRSCSSLPCSERIRGSSITLIPQPSPCCKVDTVQEPPHFNSPSCQHPRISD